MLSMIYIAQLVNATRKSELIKLGVSPRGTLALCRMAKSGAFLAGRDYVLPDDVAAIFKDVAAHRLILDARANIAAVTPAASWKIYWHLWQSPCPDRGASMKNLPVYIIAMALALYIMVMFTEPAYFAIFLGLVAVCIFELLAAVYLRQKYPSVA